jgi:hypothetical protein
VSLPRPAYGDALDQTNAIGRGPVAHDREADRLAAIAAEEINMAAVAKRGAVPRLVPAADELIEALRTLGRHHERNGGGVGASDGERGHLQSHDVAQSRPRAPPLSFTEIFETHSAKRLDFLFHFCSHRPTRNRRSTGV